ncbi:MAG: RnfABCDGE type electron transport complex subunit G [Desulfosarcinaceae bacterium]
MGEMIKMVVVLTVLSVLSGLGLAFVKDNTRDQIENNQLQFVKGPAVREILQGASNNPIKDRFRLKEGEAEHTFFVGVVDGKPDAVVFESSGKGFGGDVNIVLGVNIDTNKLIGVGVTTHSETPGVGSRAKTDPTFVSQFKGQPINQVFKVKADGGQVDAISGATITSRAVSAALTSAAKVYEQLKPEIEKEAKSFK